MKLFEKKFKFLKKYLIEWLWLLVYTVSHKICQSNTKANENLKNSILTMVTSSKHILIWENVVSNNFKYTYISK